jgi:hypothetical protein
MVAVAEEEAVPAMARVLRELWSSDTKKTSEQ